MKKYRIYYWFNAAITTECYIKANSEQEAVEKFHKMKGDKRIITIEEWED